MVSDKSNQHLWIYTADCMPILFADKNKRFVASLHCGRKGLERKIIKNLIQIFENLGTSRDDLIVAVGPSISKRNYLIDKGTLNKFHLKVGKKRINKSKLNLKNIFDLNNLIPSKKQDLIQLDLRKYAHIQLLNENIPNTNIEISNLCTYDHHNEFFSWRRNKTSSRQWNFICK